MVWNSPRISAGAFGFGSKVSKWLGPPLSQIRMQPVAFFPPVPATARSSSALARLPPIKAPRPSFRQSRRGTPLQFRSSVMADPWMIAFVVDV
ncbi:MAG: hypothetical protein Ct9H300mP1_25260 [Planctomycetaceae bacterium]|nr:MAG: hypothetical protein Ct9H300mP1_25260 [Planctomycetaceae bacterium]